MILYEKNQRIKLLFILESIIGVIILSFGIYLYLNKINLEVLSIVIPLMGLALLISGISTNEIYKIEINEVNNQVEISQLSIFNNKTILIDIYKLKTEMLKDYTGGKFAKRFKVNIFNSNEIVASLKSNLLTTNNPALNILYKKLKSIENKLHKKM